MSLKIGGYIEMTLSQKERPVSMVSIIIPNHRDTYLQETLDSVEAQTYKDYEVILLSTKDVGDIGLSKKVNLGVRRATGEAILVLCDDDTLSPAFLEESVPYLKEHDIVYTDMMNFGDRNYLEVADEWNERNLKISTVPFITSLVRKEMFNKVGGWEEKEYVYGDWNFWAKCFKAGATAYHIHKPLFNYRKHAGQGSGTTDNHTLLRENTPRFNDL